MAKIFNRIYPIYHFQKCSNIISFTHLWNIFFSVASIKAIQHHEFYCLLTGVNSNVGQGGQSLIWSKLSFLLTPVCVVSQCSWLVAIWYPYLLHIVRNEPAIAPTIMKDKTSPVANLFFSLLYYIDMSVKWTFKHKYWRTSRVSVLALYSCSWILLF